MGKHGKTVELVEKLLKSEVFWDSKRRAPSGTESPEADQKP